MRVRRCELRDLDSRVTPQWQGIALEAISDTGARMGTVAAKVDGSIAVIFERWVTGDIEVVMRLTDDLVAQLRGVFGITELRAGASADQLYRLYADRYQMTLWHAIIRYERPLDEPPLERRSAATIRPFRQEDEPAVAALAGSQEAGASLVQLSRRHEARFAVAEMDGRAAGYALSYVDAPWALFKSMVVDPSMRRSHIGWDLAIDAIQWAGARGLPSYLHTQAENQAARGLYERLGYRPVEQVRILHRVFEGR